MQKKYIISADDFGISEIADKNILKLAENGKIDRVSVMPSFKLKTDHIERLVKSRCKIDIHLNIENLQNSPKRKQAGIVYRIFHFVFLFFSMKLSKSEIKKKWEKQFENFYEVFGRYPDGINSHEHVHFFPPYLDIVFEMQKKYNIPYIRFAERKIMAQMSIIGIILTFLRKLSVKKFKKSKAKTSDFLVSLDWIKDVSSFISVNSRKKVEIVCHPERKNEFDILVNKF